MDGAGPARRPLSARRWRDEDRQVCDRQRERRAV